MLLVLTIQPFVITNSLILMEGARRNIEQKKSMQFKSSTKRNVRFWLKCRQKSLEFIIS